VTLSDGLIAAATARTVLFPFGHEHTCLRHPGHKQPADARNRPRTAANRRGSALVDRSLTNNSDTDAQRARSSKPQTSAHRDLLEKLFLTPAARPYAAKVRPTVRPEMSKQNLNGLNLRFASEAG
jgi:hypothetical protein